MDQIEKHCFLTHVFKVGSATVTPTLRRVTLDDGVSTELSPSQFLAVVELVENYGQVVVLDRLYETLCLSDEDSRDHEVLSKHMAVIRKAFGDLSNPPRYIKNISERGYCLMQKPVFDCTRQSDFKLRHNNVSLKLYSYWRKRAARFHPLLKFRDLVILAVLVFFGVMLSHSGLLDQLNLDSKASLIALPDAMPDVYKVKLLSEAQSTIPSFQRQPNTKVYQTGKKLDDSYNVSKIEIGQPGYKKLREYYSLVIADNDMPKGRKSVYFWRLGVAFMQYSDWQSSESALIDSIKLQRSLGDEVNPLLLSQALTRLAQVRTFLAQDIDGSRELLLEAINLLEDNSIRNRQSAEVLFIHAYLSIFSDNLVNAEALLREAINIVQSSTNSQQAVLARFHTSLIRVLGLQGRYVEATELANDVLAAESARIGSADMGLVPVLLEYAELLAESGDLFESKVQYRRALDILEVSVPDTDKWVRATRTRLANVLVKSGDYAKASSLYRDAIETESRLENRSVIRLSGLKLSLSDALLGASQPHEANTEAVAAIKLLDQQEQVPDWMVYVADSVYGATLMELGECELGVKLVRSAVNKMFRDGVSDPRIASRIHERKSYYEQFGPCA